jgi:hypothetical protein
VIWITELEVGVTQRILRLLTAAMAGMGLVLPALAGLPGAMAAGAGAIHPGGEVNFGGISCEIGAVLRQGKAVYLAVPASCGGIDLGKVQEGCDEPVSPLGVPVSIQGAKHRGKLVYSSFTTMQGEGVRNSNRCYYDDLALVRVDRRDRHLVSASIPNVGTPRGLVTRWPGSGTGLRLGTASATAGSTHHDGWELDASTMSTFSTWQAGAPATIGNKLVGMLIVLPKGPIPDVPLMQSPAEVYNLARSIRELRRTAGFHHVHLVG